MSARATAMVIAKATRSMTNTIPIVRSRAASNGRWNAWMVTDGATRKSSRLVRPRSASVPSHFARYATQPTAMRPNMMATCVAGTVNPTTPPLARSAYSAPLGSPPPAAYASRRPRPPVGYASDVVADGAQLLDALRGDGLQRPRRQPDPVDRHGLYDTLKGQLGVVLEPVRQRTRR